MINLNSSTPAPVNGGTNVTWQTDSSGNVSGYVARRKTTVVPASGVLTLDASQADTFLVTVNQAITSASIVNASDGQEITILWAQDATGHPVTLPSNLLGALAVSTTANKHTCQKFSYSVGDTNWYAIGVAGM